MTTRFDTNPQTGVVPGVLRHDIIAPFSPAHLPHEGRSELWMQAYNAALRGEKADRAQPAPKSKDAPYSVQEVADGLFAKSWKKLATVEGDNQ